MGKVDIITSPTGDRMAVVPLEDYERLVECAEDLEDIAACGRFRERLAAGEEDAIPSAFVDRMLAGESRVRVWREFRGLLSGALASAAAIDETALLEIEAKRVEPTVAVLKKLAAALHVQIDDLA